MPDLPPPLRVDFPVMDDLRQGKSGIGNVARFLDQEIMVPFIDLRRNVFGPAVVPKPSFSQGPGLLIKRDHPMHLPGEGDGLD